MATRNTIFQSSESISPAISGFVILSSCVNAMDATAAQFSHLLCAMTGELFRLVPSIMLAAFQAIATCALDHAQSLAICHMLVSVRPLVQFLFQAV